VQPVDAPLPKEGENIILPAASWNVIRLAK